MDVVLTCEHARKAVPRRLRRLFEGAEAVLEGHRGWDPGARVLAARLARRLGSGLLLGEVSRLLVELNRSMDHAQLFSRWSRRLPPEEREALLDRYYRPFRRAVEAAVGDGLISGRDVLHLGVHTFTPVWRGRVRSTDIGVLYDPSRGWEREVALLLRQCLAARLPDLSVHLNRPYRGWTDGHATALRARFPEPAVAPPPSLGVEGGPARGRYAGVELEVSQRFPLGPAREWRAVLTRVSDAVAAAVSIARTHSREEIPRASRIPR